jgi:hypothetical protein
MVNSIATPVRLYVGGTSRCQLRYDPDWIERSSSARPPNSRQDKAVDRLGWMTGAETRRAAYQRRNRVHVCCPGWYGSDG